MADEQPVANTDPKQVRSWAMGCHLAALLGFVIPFGNIIGPLVLWLVKKNDDPLIDANGKESLNFQISVVIYSLVAFLLVFVFIGILLLIALGIADLVLVILAAIKTNNGESFQYPFAIRLIK